MLPFLLAAQLSTAVPRDTGYSTPALRALVAEVAESNRRVPPALQSYSSHIETEVSLLVRDSLGRERAGEIEQMASRGTWERGGQYDIHVVGYRSQSVGVPYSTLSIVRGWTVPTLYGERLSLGAYFNRARRGASDTILAVHPLAADRDAYYRFSGGDTITVLRASAREIPIVRIRVTPVLTRETRLNLFDGEVDVDAGRRQIVRMRGRIVSITPPSGIRERVMVRALGVTAAAYVEFVNSEIDGQFWLPTYQRTEFQAGFGLLGQSRPVFRIVSNITDIVATTDSAAPGGEQSERRRVTVSWAPTDSIDRYAEWRADIGAPSANVHSDDFADLAPDRWRATGPPRISVFPSTLSRLVRFNRVEGLYLGAAPSVDFRSAAPGLKVGAHAGWAFEEKTIRGGVFAKYDRSLDRYGLRVERALPSTNDFVLPMSDDPGLGALFGSVDDQDYVDRASGALSYTRVLGSVTTGLLTVQAGGGRDRAERARLTRGLFGASDFRPNRGVANGSYALGSADLEIHPSVTGDFATPGVGGRAHYELARGDLSWQRVEIGVGARRYAGAVSMAIHADAGAVVGTHIPPQQLFELGGGASLPGYRYKEFAGDRAALVRANAGYRFRFLTRPMRVRNYFVPGVSPGLGASIQGGWTELSSTAARSAAASLGAPATPTDGMRATVGGGLTLFSDLIHVGVARAIDRSAPWRLAFGFGAAF